MNRRQWLGVGVAAVAGLAGAGWNAWRLRLSAADEAALSALWSPHWEGPDGSALAVSALRGRPLLVNFWATWCPPCVQELPLLNRFYEQQRASGWQVLGVAVDQPSAVRSFLARQPLAFPVAMAGLGGTQLSQQLGNTSGGLPFSVLIDADGRLVDRHLGQLHPDDLERWRQRLA